jgi:acyl-CoA thioesterase
MIESFDVASAVSATGVKGEFTCEVPEGWGQGRAAYGGLAGAYLVRAAEMFMGSERPLRSFNLVFVGPLKTGPATLTVEVLRSGGSLTHLEVRLFNEGVLATSAYVACARARASEAAAMQLPVPEMPPVEGAMEMAFVPGMMPEFMRFMEMRWTVTSFPFSGSEKGHVQGWLRPRNPATPGLPLMVGLMDAWPPPVWSLLDGLGRGSSVNWHANFAPAAFESELRPDSWYFWDSHLTYARDGYSDMDASLWSENGELLAMSRQLFADFPFDGAPSGRLSPRT